MFTKVVLFFFALVGCANATRILDYCTPRLPSIISSHSCSVTAAYPGVLALRPIMGREYDLLAAAQAKRDFAHVLYERDAVNLDTLGSQILDGLKSKGLDEYNDFFSTRIQRLKDLSGDSNVPPSHIAAEANQLLLKYRQILTSHNNLNEPTRIDDTDGTGNISSLQAIQGIITNTINLLNALGKIHGKYLCHSMHPNKS